MRYNVRDLAQGFLCPICKDVMIEPTMTTDCAHYFCRACIDKSMEEQLEALGRAACVVCDVPLVKNAHEANNGGLRYAARKDSVIRKLFPRPDLYAAADKEREEREAKRRELKRLAGGNDPKMTEEEYYRRRTGTKRIGVDKARFKPAQQKALRGGLMNCKALALFMVPDEDVRTPAGELSLPRLTKSVWMVPANMPVGTLRIFLKQVLPDHQVNAESVVLSCNGVQVQEMDWTVGSVHDLYWRPYYSEGSTMVVHYADPARCGPGSARTRAAAAVAT